MTTTLAGIRQRLRRLTGRLTTASLADSLANEQINTYYRHHLPRLLAPEALQTWFTFETAQGQSSYGIDERMRAIFPPVTLDGDRIFFSRDPGYFLEKYKGIADQPQSKPEAVLLFSRMLEFAPVPDKTYTFKAHTLYIPDELEEDGDEPIDTKWGEAIALGAAILILSEDGDLEAAQGLDSLLGYQVTLIRQDDIFTWHGMRAVPMF